jgi:hypothetical protein
MQKSGFSEEQIKGVPLPLHRLLHGLRATLYAVDHIDHLPESSSMSVGFMGLSPFSRR